MFLAKDRKDEALSSIMPRKPGTDTTPDRSLGVGQISSRVTRHECRHPDAGGMFLRFSVALEQQARAQNGVAESRDAQISEHRVRLCCSARCLRERGRTNYTRGRSSPSGAPLCQEQTSTGLFPEMAPRRSSKCRPQGVQAGRRSGCFLDIFGALAATRRSSTFVVTYY